MGWKTAHYFAGFLSAGLATVIAVNAKSSFLDSTTTLLAASLAASLSFLVTTMAAQERAKMLEQAAWELEKAMALYRSDPAIPATELGKAEARGVDILSSKKSK